MTVLNVSSLRLTTRVCSRNTYPTKSYIRKRKKKKKHFLPEVLSKVQNNINKNSSIFLGLVFADCKIASLLFQTMETTTGMGC